MPDLATDAEGVACYKGVAFATAEGGGRQLRSAVTGRLFTPLPASRQVYRRRQGRADQLRGASERRGLMQDRASAVRSGKVR